jgi:hypothetical protein
MAENKDLLILNGFRELSTKGEVSDADIVKDKVELSRSFGDLLSDLLGDLGTL